jgi:hypothetical protein
MSHSGHSAPVRCLLCDHPPRRGARRLLGRRDHECDPSIPAIGPVLVGELPVAFEVEIALRRGAQGNDESELRPAWIFRQPRGGSPTAGMVTDIDLLSHPLGCMAALALPWREQFQARWQPHWAHFHLRVSTASPAR